MHWLSSLGCVCVLCMLPVWCDPWPAPEGALQAQRFACGGGLRQRITRQTLGSAATSLGALTDGSGVTSPSSGSIRVFFPMAGADLIIGLCFGQCLRPECSADVLQCLLQDHLKDKSLQRPDVSRFCSTPKPYHINTGTKELLVPAWHNYPGTMVPENLYQDF